MQDIFTDYVEQMMANCMEEKLTKCKVMIALLLMLKVIQLTITKNLNKAKIFLKVEMLNTQKCLKI